MVNPRLSDSKNLGVQVQDGEHHQDRLTHLYSGAATPLYCVDIQNVRSPSGLADVRYPAAVVKVDH